MSLKLFRPASAFLLAGILSLSALAQKSTENSSSWAFDSIHIPRSGGDAEAQKPIVVAVIDDAFRLSHQDLKDFIHQNPRELAGNQLDDEGNNYVDDVYGWDISDYDPDVSPPEGQSRVYYHGTYVASLICRVATLYYGKEASRSIRILPVKVLSDRASRTYIRDGYKGIRYAMENGADIICLAWSGGNPGPEDLELLQKAYEKGILIIASAGNFNEEKVQFPAADPSVIAVAGIDRDFRKEENSSYGMQVDLAAPAQDVKGAHPEKDNAYVVDQGTSAAAALVAGSAAILLSENPGLSPGEIKAALLNASEPFKPEISTYGGKLGAGVLQVEKALDYLAFPASRDKHYSPLRPKGSIHISASSRKPFWQISPAGAYQGFYLTAEVSGIRRPDKHSLHIEVSDTTWNAYPLSQIPPQLFVPSPSLKVRLDGAAWRKKEEFRLSYQGKTIDSTRIYCRDTQYLNLESGEIDDGSGEQNYSNSCSCRWIISVPAGKRIKFTFERMDTQANTDFVYLVDGKTAIPENIFAMFSGRKLPPIVFSRTNEVLIWFVTDPDTTGQGWQLRYESVE